MSRRWSGVKSCGNGSMSSRAETSMRSGAAAAAGLPQVAALLSDSTPLRHKKGTQHEHWGLTATVLATLSLSRMA